MANEPYVHDIAYVISSYKKEFWKDLFEYRYGKEEKDFEKIIKTFISEMLIKIKPEITKDVNYFFNTIEEIYKEYKEIDSRKLSKLTKEKGQKIDKNITER